MKMNYYEHRQHGDGSVFRKFRRISNNLSRTRQSSFLLRYGSLLSCIVCCLLKGVENMAGCYRWLLLQLVRNASCGMWLRIVD